jgi:hypothetical protein
MHGTSRFFNFGTTEGPTGHIENTRKTMEGNSEIRRKICPKTEQLQRLVLLVLGRITISVTDLFQKIMHAETQISTFHTVARLFRHASADGLCLYNEDLICFACRLIEMLLRVSRSCDGENADVPDVILALLGVRTFRQVRMELMRRTTGYWLNPSLSFFQYRRSHHSFSRICKNGFSMHRS